MLVYDLIPLTRPEFCDPGLVRTFRAWFSSTMPLVDRFLAISAPRRGIWSAMPPPPAWC
ncbi:hypothetical protein ACFQU7_14495 [Pseudoroseomonas wenyumeiae]